MDREAPVTEAQTMTRTKVRWVNKRDVRRCLSKVGEAPPNNNADKCTAASKEITDQVLAEVRHDDCNARPPPMSRSISVCHGSLASPDPAADTPSEPKRRRHQLEGDRVAFFLDVDPRTQMDTPTGDALPEETVNVSRERGDVKEGEECRLFSQFGKCPYLDGFFLWLP